MKNAIHPMRRYGRIALGFAVLFFSFLLAFALYAFLFARFAGVSADPAKAAANGSLPSGGLPLKGVFSSPLRDLTTRYPDVPSFAVFLFRFPLSALLPCLCIGVVCFGTFLCFHLHAPRELILCRSCGAVFSPDCAQCPQCGTVPSGQSTGRS